MDPFSWAMLILGALNTASTLTSGQDVDTETPAPTSGADTADLSQIIGGQPDPLAAVSNLPTLAGPTQAAAAAASAVPKTQVSTPPQIPTPGPAVAKAGTPKPEGPPAPGLPPKPGGVKDIGQVLAAIPEALAAVAPLLGLTNQNVSRQTAAPISGGPAGGLVGRFAQQAGGIDIGQLLAALPGIRG